MKKGRVKFFKNGEGKGKGYGFITQVDEQGNEIVKSKGTGRDGADETDDYFVHVKNVRPGDDLKEGDTVDFESRPGKAGKGEEAFNVSLES